jgi:hypothetical protein
MSLANVALTDTFDTWRIRTNQIIVRINEEGLISNLAFNKANSANLLAFNTGIGANSYMQTTLAGANVAVGAGANSYANLVWSRSNTYVQTTIAGANTAVGTGANTVSVAAFAKANAALANATTTYVGNLTIIGNTVIGTTSSTMNVVGRVSTAGANVLSQTLTDGVTITWDTASGQIATVTLAGNRTMAAPTNLRVGTYILHVIQDGVGGRTLGWNSVFKWTAGVAPVLTTAANRRDVFSFVCDGTNLYGSFLPDVR